MHPTPGAQVSSVHALLSLQSTGLQAKVVVVVVVVVVLVVEVVVVTTTATRSSTQSSASAFTAGESVVLWQSFGFFASSFVKQPFVGSRPPVDFATALSDAALRVRVRRLPRCLGQLATLE